MADETPEGGSRSGAISIDPAEPADAPLLLRLLHASFESLRGRIVPESGAFAETEATLGHRLQSERAFIARIDGRPVGFVFLKARPEDAYLSRLSVLPDARRRGVARALIGHVEAAARADGRRRISLGVRISLLDNQALFSSCGFVEISREAHEGFAEPTSMTMAKAL